MFRLKISTQHGLFYDDMVEAITIKTTLGYQTILPNHSNIITKIEIGKLTIKLSYRYIYAAINRGMMYVDNDEVLIVTNSIETKEEIDVARQKQNIENYQKILNNKNLSKEEKAQAHLEIEKSKNRIKVAEFKLN
jgi:F-type H+-transporting ATPase subunit epsilon